MFDLFQTDQLLIQGHIFSDYQMSFGYSASDFITVGAICWKVYKNGKGLTYHPSFTKMTNLPPMTFKIP